MRSTRSTTQALERLAKAMGVKLTRDGKFWVAWTPQVDDLPPIPKKSSRVLAALTNIASMRDDWELLRQATRYDPGIRRGTFRPNVPTHGLSGWEEEYLERLAVTEIN
jgi:hypothetical protein